MERPLQEKPVDPYAISKVFQRFGIDALMIVGGFEVSLIEVELG